MLQIESVNNVLKRIDQLNQRFGINMVQPVQENTGKNSADGVTEVTGTAAKGAAFPEVLDAALAKEGLTVSTDGSITEETNAMIKAAANKYNVDPQLVAAVAQTESGGRQEAISPAGAIGVMQLMPETAAGLGVNPYDKQQNIEGGAKYLREMMDTFGGDVQKAVAAYNAGPQAVKDYNGVPPYRETRDYVNHVLDIYR